MKTGEGSSVAADSWKLVQVAAGDEQLEGQVAGGEEETAAVGRAAAVAWRQPSDVGAQPGFG